MNSTYSRYHQARVEVMGKGLSPTCREMVVLRPEIKQGHGRFLIQVDHYLHVLNLEWNQNSYSLELFQPLYLLGVAMAEAYRLSEIVTPAHIRVDWYSCCAWEEQWWNEDIYWYLQQKFYLEKWSWERLPKIHFPRVDREPNGVASVSSGGYLLAVSGGKESTFAWEWLRRAGLFSEAITLHHSGGVYGSEWERKFPVFELMRNSGVLHEFRMSHEQDPARYFGYEGLRNDPTITNVLFIMLFVAQARGLQYIAMANDKSSEEGNASHEGRAVNHQSAKGAGYLHRFNSFLERKGIAPKYLSLCEGVYSIGAVDRLYQWRPASLELISSCNEAQWQPGATRWCRACAKCAFAYALIEAVAGREFAIRTVGSDLIIQEDLYPIWAALYDEHLEKPFECVGEKRETLFALERLARQRRMHHQPLGFLFGKAWGEQNQDFLAMDVPSNASSTDQTLLRQALIGAKLKCQI